MSLIIGIRIAFTIAFSMKAVTTHPTKELRPDTLWKLCPTVNLWGRVSDTLYNNIPGLWVQGGDSTDKVPVGPRVITDKDGFFHVSVDPHHRSIYIFDDSMSTDPSKSIGSYGISAFQIKDCASELMVIVVFR